MGGNMNDLYKEIYNPVLKLDFTAHGIMIKSLSESWLGTRMTKKVVNFFADNPQQRKFIFFMIPRLTRQMLAVPLVSFIPHAQLITNSYATPV